MIICYQKITLCIVSVLVVLFASGIVWAGEIKGKVDIVLRDTIFIKLNSSIVPNVGDKVKVSGVGTWSVSKIKTNSVIAKKIEATGEAEAGMDVVILSSNAPDSLPVITQIQEERQIPVQTQQHVAPVAQRAQNGGKLGVTVQPLSNDLRQFFGISSSIHGLLVRSVFNGSAADKAGLETGDVIVEFNGLKLEDSSDLAAIVGEWFPGAKVSVKVARKGWEKELGVVLDGELDRSGMPTFREAPVDPEALLNQAKAFVKNKEYNEAVPLLQKAADANYAAAQNHLGLMYLNGWGVERNYSMAAEWFKKAADNGYAFGYFNLARLYENGWGVPKDERLAEEYYKKSGDYIGEYKRGARQGNAEAQAWCRKKGIAWKEKVSESAAKNYYPPLAPQQARPPANDYQRQEQNMQNREAAKQLLGDLQKLRNQSIQNLNK